MIIYSQLKIWFSFHSIPQPLNGNKNYNKSSLLILAGIYSITWLSLSFGGNCLLRRFPDDNNAVYDIRGMKDWEAVHQCRLNSFGYTFCVDDVYSRCHIKPPSVRDDLSFQYKCLAHPQLTMITILVGDHICPICATYAKGYMLQNRDKLCQSREFALAKSGS